jgi:hypothetical protein
MDVGGQDAGSRKRVEVEGGALAIAIDEDVPIARPDLLDWIERAAACVRSCYGRFPVERVAINVRAGGSNIDGVTYGRDQIVVHLGSDVTVDDLQNDWVLTHEMFHLGFPTLDDRHIWMNEGLSDYLEPITRARLGQIPVTMAWKGFVDGLPSGLPRRGEGGLDASHRHGRVYWGGNLYWLLADVQIRQQSRHRLEDALRAILDQGGDASERWEIERVLAVGDRATGTHVLHDLYEQFGRQPGSVDLAALWKSLGVVVRRGSIGVDDSAPLANIRRDLTAAP